MHLICYTTGSYGNSLSERYRTLKFLINFTNSLLYQTTIFYGLTEYVEENSPKKFGNEGEYFLNFDIYKFWIIQEMLTYYINILAVSLILVMFSYSDV